MSAHSLHHPCTCKRVCGDVAEEDDPYGICRNLERGPRLADANTIHWKDRAERAEALLERLSVLRYSISSTDRELTYRDLDALLGELRG